MDTVTRNSAAFGGIAFRGFHGGGGNFVYVILDHSFTEEGGIDLRTRKITAFGWCNSLN